MMVSVIVFAVIGCNIGRRANRSLDESQESQKPALLAPCPDPASAVI